MAWKFLASPPPVPLFPASELHLQESYSFLRDGFLWCLFKDLFLFIYLFTVCSRVSTSWCKGREQLRPSDLVASVLIGWTLESLLVWVAPWPPFHFPSVDWKGQHVHDICKVFALCTSSVSCIVPLVKSLPSLLVAGRRKGTQMTKGFEYQRVRHSQILFFCKCAKQIPTFTTGATARVRGPCWGDDVAFL